MRAILEQCGDLPLEHLDDGTVLLNEGEETGLVYVLVKGRIEILRGGTPVTVLEEPGSLAGEMSALLRLPHTATARALGDVTVHVIKDGPQYFRTHPGLAWLVARLLAHRLNAATSYVVDLKRQFENHSDHLAMVGEVLETLIHQQEQEFDPGSDRDPGRY